MRISHENNPNLSSGKIKNFIGKRRSLRVLLITMFGLGIFGFLFFATLGYGAYLKKIGTTTYFNQALINISEFDFSFIKNYAKGRVTSFDAMQIDIKFKHLMRIEYLRNQALQGKYIDDSIKDEEFPAELIYKGKTHRVKIALTGLTTEHLVNPDKWSFEVKVRGDDTVNGMKTFGLLIPKSRGYMSDWLAFELMKDQGLIGLRADFVDVSINGKGHGIYYMEERFDKHLIENNSKRESIIFKLQDGLSAYSESKLMEDPATRDQLLTLKRMWQDVMAGNLPPEKFFDMRKMAKVFVITDLMNNKHPLYPGNLRFYFNPGTGLVEPIAREFGTLNKYDRSTLSMFIEKPKESDYRHQKLRADKTLQAIYDNLEFKRHYVAEAERLSQPEFLDSLFIAKKGKIDALIAKVYRTWPFYDIPTEKLYENQEYFRSVLFSDIDDIVAYYAATDAGKVNLNIRNHQYLPVEVAYIGWRDTMFLYPEQPIIIDSKENTLTNAIDLYSFKIPTGILWSDSLMNEMKIYYNLLGSSRKRATLIYPWPYETRADHTGNPLAKTPNHNSFDFIQEDKNQGVISIPAGSWTVDRDLVIPKEKIFRINAGAKIDLVKSARIISYSPVNSQGEEGKPVIVTSSDESSMGVFITEAGKRSTLTYTEMSFLSNPRVDGWTMPAALTFYESPVDISYCTFSDNKVGDDFLNIIRSDFTIDNTLFKDINADAFDCDFCTGMVTNSVFVNIGNDGIDVSGTKINIQHVSIDNAGDKGLSAGEGSDMEASLVRITNSEIGITSKDNSTIVASDITMDNCRIGVTLFQKKSEFGPAYMTGHNITVQNAEIPYLVEDRSRLEIDGKMMTSNNDQVKKILYGAEYGKSSK